MKKLFIMKVGSTFGDIMSRCGDFDNWTLSAIGESSLAVEVIDVENGALLPNPGLCAGVIVTGSHAMVTDRQVNVSDMEQWIRMLLAFDVPYFGICYGHQLLAQAMGGVVGFHPRGTEIGTVWIGLLPSCADDRLFRFLPSHFRAHVDHAQTVLCLPPGAVCLAANPHECHHAFRIGQSAWGVQFHPEFSADVMRLYIDHQMSELKLSGSSLATIQNVVMDTPIAAQIIPHFVRFVESSLSMQHSSRAAL